MTRVHKPATFQPTIRPSWAGAMGYISVEEKAKIFEAIIKYPENTGIDSIFWEETIKPDLDLQYEKFLSTCEARKQVARTYWDNQKGNKRMQMDTNSNSKDIQVVFNAKDKDKDKDKDKSKVYKFKGITVIVDEDDYTRWKEKYNLVDLDYELEQMDCWFQESKNADRKKDWFWIVQKSLAKKQKEKYDALPKGINGKPIQNYHEW